MKNDQANFPIIAITIALSQQSLAQEAAEAQEPAAQGPAMSEYGSDDLESVAAADAVESSARALQFALQSLIAELGLPEMTLSVTARAEEPADQERRLITGGQTITCVGSTPLEAQQCTDVLLELAAGGSLGVPKHPRRRLLHAYPALSRRSARAPAGHAGMPDEKAWTRPPR